MIEISLGKAGGFGGYTQFFHGHGEAEEMIIEGLSRCLGMFIFWKRKKTTAPDLFVPRFAVSGFHIPPYIRNNRQSTRQFFRLINELAVVFEPRLIVYGGRRIETKKSKLFSERSEKDFLLPFRHLFPKMKFEGFGPITRHGVVNMYLAEDLEVFWESYLEDADK